MTARTISADDLETLARAAHADIELDRDYAYATINGRLYRARLERVEMPAEHVGGCNDRCNEDGHYLEGDGS